MCNFPKIADGQKQLVSRINLKERKFIGNTSMDPLLSIIMANMSGIRPYDLVFDPFVGTGSLIVACALMGAYAFGSDIDYLMLHGKTRPTRANHVNKYLDLFITNPTIGLLCSFYSS